jgi:hypothetical protein
VGDKSPKSKQRDQKKRDAANARGAADAKSKQDRQSYTPQIGAKGKK